MFGAGTGAGKSSRRVISPAGAMDGSSHLISIDGSSDAACEEDDVGGDRADENHVLGEGRKGVALVASMKNHAKYAVVDRCVQSSFHPQQHHAAVTAVSVLYGLHNHRRSALLCEVSQLLLFFLHRFLFSHFED